MEGLATELHSVAVQLLRSLRHSDQALGITPARLSALSVLVFGGPRSLGDLAAAEQVSPPTMSRIVAALEQAGLVERRPHSGDGRVVLLSPTARGRRSMRRGRRLRVRQLARQLQSLPEPDLACLEQAVGILRRTMPT
ncbi:MAG: MarR family transcriptional regulator [Actinomycetota bacterium]|nr:MarR family transcriptional regulator [Actinomycetota bacterium]